MVSVGGRANFCRASHRHAPVEAMARDISFRLSNGRVALPFTGRFNRIHYIVDWCQRMITSYFMRFNCESCFRIPPLLEYGLSHAQVSLFTSSGILIKLRIYSRVLKEGLLLFHVGSSTLPSLFFRTQYANLAAEVILMPSKFRRNMT